ncbi:hypothetical protein IY145_23720 [Methylosinus sp. H3A]|uniref:hypothetical protein n=1 Tax=Methylosinus sp. H3A TaxID=2785786 RepID=UPI0018C2DE87|nr:hypothetical protein [Methylosinus sp. H3A]MBG0812359.1 hypothetical protein [Methylosinus sp. H3A]
MKWLEPIAAWPPPLANNKKYVIHSNESGASSTYGGFHVEVEFPKNRYCGIDMQSNTAGYDSRTRRKLCLQSASLRRRHQPFLVLNSVLRAYNATGTGYAGIRIRGRNLRRSDAGR